MQKAVLIGKWQFLHNGHRALINMAIKVYGLDNILIIVGSAQHTNPYTAKERMEYLMEAFPNILVAPVLDYISDEVWIDDIREAIDRFFPGEGPVDIIAGESYPWQGKLGNPVIWHRNEGPFPEISSTKIRESVSINK